MGKIYGYARISTPSQSIDRQIRNIREIYGNAVIYKETYTGTSTVRPKWNKLFNTVQAGDTIIFDSVSRMSRNAKDGFEIYMDLYNRGVELIFIREPMINTEHYKATVQIASTGTDADLILEGVNKYLMVLAERQIFAAFAQAQKEVDDLHKRTSEGMETAKRSGKQIGLVKGTKLVTKKSVEMKENIRSMSKCFDGNMTDAQVIKILGLARNTYYKYKKELLDEEAME